jgi:hypothetical protein
MAIVYAAMDGSAAVSLKERRQAEFASFANLIAEIPFVPVMPKRTEPLLIRLQKALDQMDFADRSPKMSGGGASPVTLSLEGVPFDRISRLLERLSQDPSLTTPSFRLERSGASPDRFDFSASFTE